MSVASPGWSSRPQTSTQPSKRLAVGIVAGDDEAVLDVARAVEPLEGRAAEKGGEHRANKREGDQAMRTGVRLRLAIEGGPPSGAPGRAQVPLPDNPPSP